MSYRVKLIHTFLPPFPGILTIYTGKQNLPLSCIITNTRGIYRQV